MHEGSEARGRRKGRERGNALCGKLVELRQLGFNPIKYDPTLKGINSLIF
jgi:hypothetical protein